MNLYAVWTPNIYKLTLNNNEATTPGTTEIYEKYNTGWYSDENASNLLSLITIPVKIGFVFEGYYTKNGIQIIDENGLIVDGKTNIFSENGTLSAKWGGRIYTVTLNNDGATIDGTSTIFLKYNDNWYQEVTAENVISSINIPSKTCYKFAGYYTDDGTQIIDENGNIKSGKTTIFTNVSNTGMLTARWTSVSTLYVANNGNNNNGGYSSNNPLQYFNTAYQCPGNITIKVLSDFEFGSSLNANLNKTVTIESYGTRKTIKRKTNYTGALINLTSGKLTTTNIIFDGNYVDAAQALINISNATAYINENTIVRNGITSRASGFISGGINVNSSTVEINGGEILNNKTNTSGIESQGGGIRIEGSTLTLNSGKINNNETNGHGGGVFVSTSTFIINGGEVSSNKSAIQSGGIGVNCSGSNSVVEMNNGKISYNEARSNAGGIGLTKYTDNCTSSFTLNGGNINNNKSGQDGGGVFTRGGASFTFNGGIISDNKAAWGGGYLCENKATFTYNGGAFNSNKCTNTRCGGGARINTGCNWKVIKKSYSGNTPDNYSFQ